MTLSMCCVLKNIALPLEVTVAESNTGSYMPELCAYNRQL